MALIQASCSRFVPFRSDKGVVPFQLCVTVLVAHA